MPDVVVREAALADARGIARVSARTWQIAYEHVFPTERLAGIVEERRAEQWSDTIREAAPRSHTLVVHDDEGVAGFASCGPALDPEADAESIGELYAVYVLPESWGQGIGQALMAEILRRLRDDGFQEAVLWVIEDNPRTRRYYERAGWHLDGGVKDQPVLDIHVRQVRYRIALG